MLNHPYRPSKQTYMNHPYRPHTWIILIDLPSPLSSFTTSPIITQKTQQLVLCISHKCTSTTLHIQYTKNMTYYKNRRYTHVYIELKSEQNQNTHVYITLKNRVKSKNWTKNAAINTLHNSQVYINNLTHSIHKKFWDITKTDAIHMCTSR